MARVSGVSELWKNFKIEYMKKAITELEKVIKYAEHARDTHELMKDEGAVYTLNIKIGVLKQAIRILKGWE